MNEKFSRAVCALAAMVVMFSASPAHAIEAPADQIPTSDPAVPEPTPVPDPALDPVDDPNTPRPPITANEFFPEEQDITTCIGVLERPGCGSEQRGGWRQTLTLLAIFGGLAIVFGNVIRGVRKRNG